MEHDTKSPTAEIADLARELGALREQIAREPGLAPGLLEGIHPNFAVSARNLLQYLALRRRDLRPLQRRLASLGLSSLGRAEANVLPNVDAVLAILRRLEGGECPATPVPHPHGKQLLAEHTLGLLGAPTAGRGVRIMVTMPGEAADDPAIIHDLLRQGMDCMRINCAHDDAGAWQRMIGHLRQAESALGRSCRVVMDLAGPKLRTGPLEPGPEVMKVRPARDEFGRVSAPARVWLTDESAPVPAPAPANGTLPVNGDWLRRLAVGEHITCKDTRDSHRTMHVIDVSAGGCWAELSQTAYFTTGATLRRERIDSDDPHRSSPIGRLPALENAIILRPGDLLTVTGDQHPGRPAAHDSAGRLLGPPQIGCTIPEVLDDIRTGDPIWFDDGKIGGLVEKIDIDHMIVRITHASPAGDKLRGDKGINLPETELNLPALTAKDIEDLSFVATHADVVELSFANTAGDVRQLQELLARFGNHQPAIVLKIETRRGFQNLPEMLLAAMRTPCCGVMIARGDLAVETGFERLAEVQEEILWICEAAHVPVIWATQVLETLAKTGMPSRAEITDAAMGIRAECVMLNKGPHVVSAVRALDDILRRMQAHQTKKSSMLRELRLARPIGVELGD